MKITGWLRRHRCDARCTESVRPTPTESTTPPRPLMSTSTARPVSNSSSDSTDSEGSRCAHRVRRSRLKGSADLARVQGFARTCGGDCAPAVYDGDESFRVTDVRPVGRGILSAQPFALRVRFHNPEGAVALAAVTVHRAGDPFVIERRLTKQTTRWNAGRTALRLEADAAGRPGGVRRGALPRERRRGQASITVGRLRAARRTRCRCRSRPAGARVTGTLERRRRLPPGVRHVPDRVRDHDRQRRLACGLDEPRVNWEFWDGPVGSGTRVESGASTGRGPISVPAFGTWRGGVWFSSPRGSGIFNKYHRKEDMAISDRDDGRRRPADRGADHRRA